MARNLERFIISGQKTGTLPLVRMGKLSPKLGIRSSLLQAYIENLSERLVLYM
jgi:hypothetical protein